MPVGLNLHLGKLGAGRCDLLDPQLAEFRLQLSKLLRQIILVLGPQLAGLDFARRLRNCKLWVFLGRGCGA